MAGVLFLSESSGIHSSCSILHLYPGGQQCSPSEQHTPLYIGQHPCPPVLKLHFVLVGHSQSSLDARLVIKFRVIHNTINDPRIHKINNIIIVDNILNALKISLLE